MKKSAIAALAFISVFTACKKTDDPEPTPLPAGSVYVVGNDNLAAKYWMNNEVINLPGVSGYSEATDIIFSGKDQYILGDEGNVLKYWKNGVVTNLTDGSYPVYPFGIALKGSDVYVAGDITTSNNVIASCWKNGVLTKLSDGLNGLSYAWGIAINDTGDIYIVGSEGYKAKYWKNGVSVNLTDGTYPASAYAITIKGKDIYFAGKENEVVKYWKNGIAINVTGAHDDNLTYNVSSIFVNGTDVYVGGQVKSTDVFDVNKIYSVAVYWKNNVATELTGRKAPAGLVNSMAVYGNDVYAAGHQFDEINSRNVARYWKNGVAVSLTDSSKAQADLYKIIVQ